MPAAAPKQTPTPRKGVRSKQPEEVRVSRMQRLMAEGVDLPLPAIPGEGAYLVAHLLEVGPVSASAAGSSPVSWTDLQAWQQQIGVELQPWETRMLRSLSTAYAAELRRAEAHDALSPMAAEVTSNEQRESVARRVGIEFRAMAAAQRARAEQCK